MPDRPNPAASPAAEDLAAELEAAVGGEVRFDRVSRLLYSTDASIYQVLPLGVVLPRSADDVSAAVEIAGRMGAPVLPRGGGTSLAGQTVGAAVVIDYSKHMRDLVGVDPERMTARVQPGIVLDELNRALAGRGLMFAPDPSTSNRGNVGGALGNNSCGAHSIVWGKTSDNVESVRTVLSDGTSAELGRLDPAGAAALRGRGGLLANVASELAAVGTEYGPEIDRRYPKVSRRVSGYNLDVLPRGPEEGLNLAEFVVGSEGTLLNITEATLRLVPVPARRALMALHFSDLIESMEATVLALETGPAAVEHVGEMILRQARDNISYSRMMGWVEGDPAAILLVEFIGDTDAEVRDGLDRLGARMRRSGLGYAATRIEGAAAQAQVWAVRKAGLGLMMNAPGPEKPLPFVEDAAVSPERLPEFVRRFDEIVTAAGTRAGYYGHAGVGCLHIRPLIDPRMPEGVARMARIAEEVSDLVLEFGGSLSGEHGDGLVRSPFLEKMFGPEITGAFRRVKDAFDPGGIMNPGKIVDPPGLTENLRIGPGYRTADLKTAISFRREGGIAAAIEMCNGQGACRKPSGGTMCPSFMATRDEEHSTRGRANALRSVISGTLPLGELTGERIGRVMDLCLGCKACRAECPSNVDMAKLKYEVAARCRAERGPTLRERAVGGIDRMGALGSLLAPASNWVLGSEAGRELIERTIGIDRRRTLPSYAGQTFRQWMRARGPRQDPAPRGRVVLFADTLTNHNHPEIGRAAVEVIEALGYEVSVPGFRCCGRPQLSVGDVARARRNAAANVAIAAAAMEDGATLVGLEPSCALAFRDEYLYLLDGNPQAERVAAGTALIDEFLSDALPLAPAALAPRPGPRTLLHGHCQQEALCGSESSMAVLGMLPGRGPERISAGCCGMAGSFGFEAEHYDVSMAIGELSLFPAIRDQEGNFDVVSMGVSCRQQIADGTGVRARHLVEVVADSLASQVP